MKRFIKNIDRRECAFCVLTCITVLLIFFRFIFKLSALGIDDDDEAWHIANAYDMFRNNRWIINTHGGMVDYYNSKPPLGLVPIILSMKVFGPTMIAVKIPAVVEGMVICILLILYLIKKYSAKEAFVFSTLFLILDSLFNFHMFRTANLDALFALFFVLTIICLDKAREKSIYLVPAGLFVGLAFLTKSFHIMCVVPVCILAIPVIDKKDRIRNIVRAMLVSMVTVIPWAVKRYMFDGTDFFKAMLFGEVDQKVTSGITLDYLLKIKSERIFIILAVVLILYLCAVVISNTSNSKRKILFLDFKETAIYWLGLIVPIVSYSIAGSYNIWYIYPSYIIAAIVGSIYICKATAMLKSMNLAYAGIVVASLILGLISIYNYKDVGTGGGQAYEYWGDLREFRNLYGTQYDGSNIYIQNVSRTGDGELDSFHGDLFAYSVLLNDFNCIDGGIEAWQNDGDGILILNKELWDKYQGVLTGHVILQDNGYLWFSTDMY